MIEPVGEYRTMAAGERRDEPEVREIAGREIKRSGQPDEARECVFQCLVRPRVPENEMRGTGTDAVQPSTFLHGRHELGVRGEPEVIIAAERDVFAPVDGHTGPLRCLEHAAPAQQTRRIERRKLSRQ